MKKSLSFIPQYFDLVLSLALGLFLFWAYTQHSGLGLSPDSVAYLSTAEHLLAGKGAVDYSGEAFVLFPLGYPFFLSLALWASPLSSASTLLGLNACLWVFFLVHLRQALLRWFPTTAWVRWWVLAWVAGSSALLEVFTMVWSETLFLVVLALFLVAATAHAQSPPSRQKNTWFWCMVLLCAAGMLTRFAGLSLLLTGLLLLPPKASTWLRFVVFSSLPLGLNLLRNHWAAQQLAGVRQVANQSAGEKAAEMGQVLQQWLPLGSLPAEGLGWAWLVLALGVLLKTWLRPNYPLKAVEMFGALYPLFLFLLSNVSRFEPLSNRLLIPAFLPLVLGMAQSLLWVQSWASTKSYWVKKILFPLALASLLVAGLLQQYRAQAETLEGVWYAGIPGYTEDMWQHSALWQFLQKKDMDPKKLVYTNAREAYYMGTRRNAQPLPHKDLPAEIAAYQQQQNIYVVWFFNGENMDLLSAEAALAHRNITKMFQFQDGWVAELSPAGPSSLHKKN